MPLVDLQQLSKKLEAFNEHHRTLQKPHDAQRREVAFDLSSADT